MRVKVLMDLSDHLRGYAAEEVAEMPDDQAKRWIEAGYAVAEGAAAHASEESAAPRTHKR